MDQRRTIVTATGHPALARFGLSERDLIGLGGESHVYALDAAKILRVRRQPAAAGYLERLQTFLAELEGRLPFATPAIEEIAPDGSWTVEKRLPGRAMTAILAEIGGSAREHAWRNYVAAIDAIGTLALPDGPYGHLVAPDPVTADDWPSFARRTLKRFFTGNRATIDREIGDADIVFAKAEGLVEHLPLSPQKVLVHGDYFPGNVLLDDNLAISAVIDFGIFTLAGDAFLDDAVAWLTLETMDECTPADCALVRALIEERRGSFGGGAEAFYRAWLGISMADPANAEPPYPRLYGWSLEQLRRLAGGERTD